MRTPKKMLWGALVVLLVAFFSGASTALAQQACPRPARAAEVTPPSVTAPQVEAGTGDLREFALAARDYLDGFETAADLIYSACLFRNEEDWRSGSTYVVTMSPDGRIIFHSDMAALSGRRLEDSLYRSIARAVGVSQTGMIGNPDGRSLPGGVTPPVTVLSSTARRSSSSPASIFGKRTWRRKPSIPALPR